MVGRNIVLNADEPIVGIGRPLKRIRIRVNTVIVPIESLVITDTFIFIQLENAVMGSDDVEAQYNPELVRPVVNGIIAVDNAEELKAITLTLAKTTVGQSEIAASMQCAVLVALDDLDEDGVTLSGHVPDFGFTTWEEEVAGQYVGQDNGMINTTVFKEARGGQDLAVFDNYRIHCDMRRSTTDGVGESGILLLNSNGTEVIAFDAHLDVGWRRVSPTLVDIEFFRRNNLHQSIQAGIFVSAFSFGLGAELRFIFVVKWPVIQCFTAPAGQNSPKTLIGTIALNGEIRDGARFGIEGGIAGPSATLFGGGATGEFAFYQLGPEQNNVVQIAASVLVRDAGTGAVQITASIGVGRVGQVAINALIGVEVI